MNCRCLSCHPEPIAVYEWLCPDCAVALARERRKEALLNCTFDGKPMDSECFYGYHDRCHGCNCSCHTLYSVGYKYGLRTGS